MYNEEAADEQFSILAYFTLALQVIKLPNKLSNRKIKELDGFSAKINGEIITEFPAILIGQIGKNDEHKNDISGFDVMEYCMAKVLEGQARLGGRIVTLECKDIPYLIQFYEQFGFKKLEREYENDELIQLIRVFQGNELMDNDIIP